MTTYSDSSSSTVRLNIGGKKFCTTVDTLTHREPHSMLAAMFSGRHTVSKDSEKGYVFIDREGKHFRHILNWLRDGVAPISKLSDLECVELLQEAEYYQLLGLVDKINEVLNNKKADQQRDVDLTRTDIIKCVQPKDKYIVSLIGVNLSGLDLSELHLPDVNFNFACLKTVNFFGANLDGAQFQKVDAENANFCNATMSWCRFSMANLCGASLVGANLQDAYLPWCRLYDADLRSACLKRAQLIYAKLERANLEGANLEDADLTGANLSNANLNGANLQRARLNDVNLQDTCLEGANLFGATRFP